MTPTNIDPSYREFVGAQVCRNPCLNGLASFLSGPHKPFGDISLALYAPSEIYMRRILCMEDIDSYSIEKLGTLLDINPLFFATYISTSFVGIDKSPSPPLIALFPSALASDDSLHLHYQRVINLPSFPGSSRNPYEFKSSGNILRSVRRLASLFGTHPGLVRSCCSILLKIIGLILVDSTDADLIIPSAPGTQHERHYERTPQVPIQGGFEDFAEMPKYSQFRLSAKSDSIPQKSSILQTILHYYRNPPPNFDSANPSIMALSYYPLKIVGAEWMTYIQLMSCYVKFYEYSFRGHEHRSAEADIIDLQRWRRRGKQSLHKLYLVELFMDKHLCPQPTKPQLNGDMKTIPYTTLREDFRYLSTQIEHYSRALEFILPVATTTMQLAEARRSIIEAANVRYLTYIALVFVPLTFASSLFSMQEGFIPGQGNFWIYATVAVPLMIVVLALSLVTSVVRGRWKQVLE
ncbi:uncharacterized protein F4807DRAFT_470863 [Annulohypoxylon truncatum]|uniref:uncharacterized protein n=1 Tax=Annulohypoxylon truncatum TaxID=327061 RepID=UPI0020085A19|nr:uncharacterized protein F4807DRAFT_470863 [Annulohypoxylon truncatum]KAI1213574.1 hypothetical protein F4807DRAFT_470863 [Annulohypoxylon truncatum]